VSGSGRIFDRVAYNIACHVCRNIAIAAVKQNIGGKAFSHGPVPHVDHYLNWIIDSVQAKYPRPIWAGAAAHVL